MPHAVAYAMAMRSIAGVKVERKTKRIVWKRLRDNARMPFGTVELSPGLSLDLDPLVSDAWGRMRSHLDTHGRHLDMVPELFGGEPIIKGSRISCRSVPGRQDGSETQGDLTEDHPHNHPGGV